MKFLINSKETSDFYPSSQHFFHYTFHFPLFPFYFILCLGLRPHRARLRLGSTFYFPLSTFHFLLSPLYFPLKLLS